MKKAKKQVKPVSKTVAAPAKRAVSSKKKISVPAKKVKAKTVKAVNKKVSKVVKAAKPKVAAKKPAAVQGTVLSSVLSTVKRSKNGVAIAKIKEKTGLSPRQLSNALYKLSKSGKIASKERGVYIAK
jgi:predicted Rossmann fold nucleotide-binding protein DprA/Smf involved in DNA uptake